jgi:putative peptidoglycan lipid II flippase
MIATLLAFGSRDQGNLAVALAWGSVAGSALQFGVQLPVVLRLARALNLRPGEASGRIREVLRNFVPVFFSRGVVQISAYVDAWLASWLGRSAVSGLTSAQLLYTLPVSLFGMSISAAELPAMSSALGSEADIAAYLQRRLDSGLRRIAFFVVPSAMAFLALGDVITAALFQTGQFRQADSYYVWGILAGSAIGLLASTLGRLYSSTYYALRDTRTPLRFAVVRVALTTVLGYVCALPLPRWIGVDPRWGVAGLTASAGVAGWLEFTLLRRALNARIGKTGIPASVVARMWGAALVAAGAAWGMKLGVSGAPPIPAAIAILGTYGGAYVGCTWLFGVGQASGLSIFRRFGR